MPKEWQAVATSLPLSSPGSITPPCLTLPFPEGWDQGTNLEAERNLGIWQEATAGS